MRATGFILLLILVAGHGAFAWEGTDPSLLAVISSINGKVEVMKGKTWTPAGLMQPLHLGDHLRIAAGGKATLSFVKGGLRIRVPGPSEVVIEKDAARSVSGATGTAARPDQRSGLPLAAGINIDRMGGGVSRGAESLVVATDPKVIKPVIAWIAKSRYSQYTISIRGMGDDSTKVELTAPGDPPGPGGSYFKYHEFQVPSDVNLGAGKAYFVYLSGEVDGEKTAADDPGILAIEDQATQQRLQSLAARAHSEFARDPEDTSPIVELITLYETEQLYGPALEEALGLLKLHPQDKNLYLLVGGIYLNRLDTRSADEMFALGKKIR